MASTVHGSGAHTLHLVGQERDVNNHCASLLVGCKQAGSKEGCQGTLAKLRDENGA